MPLFNTFTTKSTSSRLLWYSNYISFGAILTERPSTYTATWEPCCSVVVTRWAHRVAKFLQPCKRYGFVHPLAIEKWLRRLLWVYKDEWRIHGHTMIAAIIYHHSPFFITIIVICFESSASPEYFCLRPHAAKCDWCFTGQLRYADSFWGGAMVNDESATMEVEIWWNRVFKITMVILHLHGDFLADSSVPAAPSPLTYNRRPRIRMDHSFGPML